MRTELIIIGLALIVFGIVPLAVLLPIRGTEWVENRLGGPAAAGAFVIVSWILTALSGVILCIVGLNGGVLP